MPPKKKEVAQLQPFPPDDFDLTYIDFIPEQQEKFRDLMDKANAYLSTHHHVKAKTCESYETKAFRKGTCVVRMMVDSTLSGYIEHAGEKANYCCRCLRLWLVPREPDDPIVQELDYLTVAPECVGHGGLVKHPKFEDFPTMLDKLDRKLKLLPLPGQILNLDTQEVRFSEWKEKFDFDETYWAQPGVGKRVCFLNLLRIVYVRGSPAYEQIGYHDFQPMCYDEGNKTQVPDFEPFMEVSNKAQSWIKDQEGKRILNIQTLQYRLPWNAKKGTGSIDSKASLCVEGGRKGLLAVRIVRVYYSISDTTEAGPPPHITYRAFHPALVRAGGKYKPPEFESHIENLKRVWAYLKHTKARVFGVETLPCTVIPDTDPDTSIPESSLEYNAMLRRYGNFQVFVIRLYVDGDYAAPPMEAMPKLPVVLPPRCNCCCTIL